MNDLLNELSVLAKHLLPILMVVVLIMLCIFLKRLITFLSHLTKTINHWEFTTKLVDQSLEKLQSPLDTSVKYAKSFDHLHDEVTNVLAKVSQSIMNGFNSFKKGSSKKEDNDHGQEKTNT